MDDSTIAWMISGGSRAERREDRLQRQHRVILAETIRAERSAAGDGWRDRVTGWIGTVITPETTGPDCCAA